MMEEKETFRQKWFPSFSSIDIEPHVFVGRWARTALVGVFLT